MAKTDFKSIDQYHKMFSGEALKRMQTIRKIIHAIAPDAEESISYQIPCFKYQGNLIYYAAFPKHISLAHPYSKAFIHHFKKELADYKVSKSVIQFPNDQPLPEKLIKQIITFRKKENEQTGKEKSKVKSINAGIQSYNNKQSARDKEICDWLAAAIDTTLTEAESKIWHAHPVWFLNGNPIVGYSKQTKGVRLMFWSGADFEEDALNVRGGKFKDASIFYTDASELKHNDLKRWLKKSKAIQWDYKNIVKRKGQLERLK